MQLTPTKLGIAVLLAFSSIGTAVGGPQLLIGLPPVTCIMRPMTKGCTLTLSKDGVLLAQGGPALDTIGSDLRIRANNGSGIYTCCLTCPGMNTHKKSTVISTKTTVSGTTIQPTTFPLSTTTTTNPPSTAQPTTPSATAQSTTAKAQTTPVQTTPVQTTPAQTTPVQTTPVQTTPVQTTPVQTTPVQTTPAQTTPVQTTPAQTTPVQTTPAQITPGQTTPVQTIPVQTTPAQITPGQTTPVQTTPVQTTPAQTTPAQTTPAQTTPATTTPATTEPPPDACKCKEAKGDDVPCLRQKGTCESISKKSCDAGKYPASNCPQLCPVGRICCVPADNGAKTCTARGGTCQDAADNMIECKGYYQTGLCPGDLNIQCCLPFS